MGLNLDYFYSLTPREFDNIRKGFIKKEEARIQLSWEQTRTLMYAITAPNLPKAKRNMKITEFFPLPWDETKKPKKQLSKKELGEMFKKWDKIKQ